MVKKLYRGIFICAIPLLLLITFSLSQTTWAETILNASEETPDRYGIGITAGNTYDPVTDIDFLQVNAFVLCDYDKVWHHDAPDPLRFKVECNLGVTTSSPHRTIASTNILALYYLDDFSSRYIRPYMEAGTGLIYTDFQVEGQGLRINFNPQLGIGTEIYINSEPALYMALRAHHFSNSELHRKNRGVNSVALVIGRLF